MDKLILVEIRNKRSRLENLINNRQDLQNKDIINCSMELDGLIIKYQKRFLEKDNIAI